MSYSDPKEQFTAAVAAATGLLAAKHVVVKLLKVRARVGSHEEAWKEDEHFLQRTLLGRTLSAAFLPYGPLTSKQAVERLAGLEDNIATNEPILLLAAAAYGSAADPATLKAIGLPLLLTAVACRFVHTTSFLTYPHSQPWRALSWTGGLAGTLYFGVVAAATYWRALY
ncbi:unnamed protein product [Pedinophyceae sp. YPF-701]|nr:unnamed protein product [Pedinophyceae sp. YPF-701]